MFEERPDSLRDDTEAFALRLIKAGVCVTAQRIPEAMHGFTTNRTPAGSVRWMLIANSSGSIYNKVT